MSLGKPSSGGWSSRHRGWGRCPHAQGSPQCKPAPTAACSPLPSFHCFLPHISAQHRKSLPLPPRIAAALPSLLYSWPRALLSPAAPRWAVPRARPAGPCTAWCRCELRAGTAASGLALPPALQRAHRWGSLPSTPWCRCEHRLRSASCPSAGTLLRFPDGRERGSVPQCQRRQAAGGRLCAGTFGHRAWCVPCSSARPARAWPQRQERSQHESALRETRPLVRSMGRWFAPCAAPQKSVVELECLVSLTLVFTPLTQSL